MCPVCREPMISFELEGVEIDRCVVCGGTWLDAGELERITELAGVTAGGLGEAIDGARDRRRTRRACPRCPHRLRQFHVGTEGEIEIDRCPVGHGLWFDRGEMRALIRSFGGELNDAVAGFFADLYQNELGATNKGE